MAWQPIQVNISNQRSRRRRRVGGALAVGVGGMGFAFGTRTGRSLVKRGVKKIQTKYPSFLKKGTTGGRAYASAMVTGARGQRRVTNFARKATAPIKSAVAPLSRRANLFAKRVRGSSLGRTLVKRSRRPLSLFRRARARVGLFQRRLRPAKAIGNAFGYAKAAKNVGVFRKLWTGLKAAARFA